MQISRTLLAMELYLQAVYWYTIVPRPSQLSGSRSTPCRTVRGFSTLTPPPWRESPQALIPPCGDASCILVSCRSEGGESRSFLSQSSSSKLAWSLREMPRWNAQKSARQPSSGPEQATQQSSSDVDCSSASRFHQTSPVKEKSTLDPGITKCRTLCILATSLAAPQATSGGMKRPRQALLHPLQHIFTRGSIPFRASTPGCHAPSRKCEFNCRLRHVRGHSTSWAVSETGKSFSRAARAAGGCELDRFVCD